MVWKTCEVADTPNISQISELRVNWLIDVK